ncbi:hypothetical protein M3936_00925 [Sutcliffiella horikoshii]|nr:hypothetical protein [Sutcliffiella horikoshii]MCM3616132.1 hypothetical protein [Sutcliffiella horikoshii]
MSELKIKDGNEFVEYKLESYSTDFKVVEVNVTDPTEFLPALVNPVKLNF